MIRLTQKLNDTLQEDELRVQNKTQAVSWLSKQTPFPSRSIMELKRTNYCKFRIERTKVELELTEIKNDIRDGRYLRLWADSRLYVRRYWDSFTVWLLTSIKRLKI